MRVSRESREKLSHKNRSVGRGRRGGVPHETFRKPRRRRAAKLNCEAGGRAPRARHRLAGRAAQTQYGNSRVNGVGGPRRGTHGRSAEKFWRKKKRKKPLDGLDLMSSKSITSLISRTWDRSRGAVYTQRPHLFLICTIRWVMENQSINTFPSKLNFQSNMKSSH